MVTITRQTAESQIDLELTLNGTGQHQIETPVPFLNHMLAQLARHGGFDVKIRASGDVEVDAHHTVEDLGICLGQAFANALGDRRGIERFGSAFAPLDEALAHVVVDLSGRPYFVMDHRFPNVQIGNFNADLTHDFLLAFATHAKCNLHVRVLAGRNLHHQIEATFKALARALHAATKRRDFAADQLPSTKEHLD